MRKRKAPKRKIGRVKNWSPEQRVRNADYFDALREEMRRKGYLDHAISQSGRLRRFGIGSV